ncbi:LapA family protein [Brevibacterium casei]|uniref:LapA family protein n=1 Tax=Brevibacterium casei TaxID=33889 RepID=UPI002468558D|nr:lipopolysaccharide assembly protein LapA domain-containing protein [Brevibacterium casei]MDH5149788.1 lipopolysaccharide assembly protein LapA domain-containing protein [Brevibacterium casei]
MSSQDPRGRSQTPEELLAETDALLGQSQTPAGQSPAGQAPIERSPAGQSPTGQSPTRTSRTKEQRGGMSAGMWISLILGAAIVVLLLIFILQNNVPADFQYFGWQFQLPLGVAMLFAAIGGIFVAGIIGSVRIFVLSRRLKKIERSGR